MSGFELTLSMAIVSGVLMVGSLAVSSDGVSLLRGHLGGGLTAASWLPIVTNSLGGILVGQVTKHMGGVSKGFSIVGGLVVCGVVQVRAACHDFSLRGSTRLQNSLDYDAPGQACSIRGKTAKLESRPLQCILARSRGVDVAEDREH